MSVNAGDQTRITKLQVQRKSMAAVQYTLYCHFTIHCTCLQVSIKWRRI